jgi:hypothetical protein
MKGYPPNVNGFFHRRSPVLLHGLLHRLALGRDEEAFTG